MEDLSANSIRNQEFYLCSAILVCVLALYYHTWLFKQSIQFQSCQVEIRASLAIWLVAWLSRDMQGEPMRLSCARHVVILTSDWLTTSDHVIRWEPIRLRPVFGFRDNDHLIFREPIRARLTQRVRDNSSGFSCSYRIAIFVSLLVVTDLFNVSSSLSERYSRTLTQFY